MKDGDVTYSVKIEINAAAVRESIGLLTPVEIVTDVYTGTRAYTKRVDAIRDAIELLKKELEK